MKKLLLFLLPLLFFFSCDSSTKERREEDIKEIMEWLSKQDNKDIIKVFPDSYSDYYTLVNTKTKQFTIVHSEFILSDLTIEVLRGNLNIPDKALSKYNEDKEFQDRLKRIKKY